MYYIVYVSYYISYKLHIYILSDMDIWDMLPF